MKDGCNAVPENRKENRLLYAILAATLLYSTASGILQMLLPAYAVSLSISAAALGLIMSVGGLGRLLFIVPSGFLMDQYGAGRIFLYSAVASLVSTLLFLKVNSSGVMAALVLISFTAQSVSFMSLQVEYINHVSGTCGDLSRTGRQKTAALIGFYLAGTLAGGFFIRGGRYYTGFIMVGILLLSGICLMFYSNGKRDETEAAAGLQPGDNIRQLVKVMKNGELIKAALLETVMAIALVNYRTFIIPLGVKSYGVGTQTASMAVLLHGIAFILSAMAGEFLLKLVPLRRLVLCGIILVFSGCVTLACFHIPFFLFSGSAVFGLGAGILNFANFLRLSMVEGEKGKASSLLSLGIGLGNALGPLAGGAAGEALGIGFVFLIPAVILVALSGLIIGNYPLTTLKGAEKIVL